MKLLFLDSASGNAPAKGSKKGGLGAVSGEKTFSKVLIKANMFQAKIAESAAVLKIKPGVEGGLKLPSAKGESTFAAKLGLTSGSRTGQHKNPLALLGLDKNAALLQKGKRVEKLPHLTEKLNTLHKLMDEMGKGELGKDGETLLAQLEALLKEKGKDKQKKGGAIGLNLIQSEKSKGENGKKVAGHGAIEEPKVKKGKGHALETHGKVEGKVDANKLAEAGLLKATKQREVPQKGEAFKLKPTDEAVPAELVEKALAKAVKGKKTTDAKVEIQVKAPVEKGAQPHLEKAKPGVDLAVDLPKKGDSVLNHLGKGVRLNEAEVVQITRQWAALKHGEANLAPKGKKLEAPHQKTEAPAKAGLASVGKTLETAQKAGVVEQALPVDASDKAAKGAKKKQDPKFKKAVAETTQTSAKKDAKHQPAAKAEAAAPKAVTEAPVEPQIKAAKPSAEAVVEEALSATTGKKTVDTPNFRDVLKATAAPQGPEQTAQVKSPGSEQARFPQPMFNQMTDGLRQAYILRPRSITVKLTPEDLGEVKLKVAIENEQLRAQIHTESHKVAAIIKEHQGDLEHRLREQGIDLDRFDVKQQTQNGDERNRQFGRQGMDGDGQFRGNQRGSEESAEGGSTVRTETEHHETVRAAVEDGAPLNITV